MNCAFCGFVLLKKSTFVHKMLKLHIVLHRKERLVSIHCKWLKLLEVEQMANLHFFDFAIFLKKGNDVASTTTKSIFSKVANGVFNFSTKTCFWRYLVRREHAYGVYASWTTVLLRFCSNFQNLCDLAEKWFVGIEFGRKAEILKWS